MRIRTLLLLAIAVVLAGGTAMLARTWLNAQRSHVVAQAAPVLPPPSKSVLVAVHPIDRGEILKAADLAWQAWPETGVNNAYIVSGSRTPASFAGWVARYPLSAGEPLTTTKLVAPGGRGFLAAVLEPGMRAVSIEVNTTTGISGFVFPGDRVDILVSYTVPNTGSPNPGAPEVHHKAAETVLHNVRVIAVGQQLQGKEGQAILAKNVTLEVTPKQSEIVTLASEMGRLSLSLRSLVAASAPDAAKPAQIVDAADVVGDSDGKRESPAADSQVSATGPTYTTDNQISLFMPQVTVLRGNTK